MDVKALLCIFFISCPRTSSLENSPCMLVTREAENTGIIHLLGNTLCRHMNMHIVTGFWHNLSKKGWYSMYPPLLLRFWSMGIWLWQLWENGPNDHFFVTVRKMNPSPRKKIIWTSLNQATFKTFALHLFSTWSFLASCIYVYL